MYRMTVQPDRARILDRYRAKRTRRVYRRTLYVKMASANSKRLRYKGRFVSADDPVLLLPSKTPTQQEQQPLNRRPKLEKMNVRHTAKGGIEIDSAHDDELFNFVSDLFAACSGEPVKLWGSVVSSPRTILVANDIGNTIVLEASSIALPFPETQTL